MNKNRHCERSEAIRIFAIFWIATSLTLLAMTAMPTYAASPKEDLEQTRNALDQARERQVSLAEETRTLETELKALQEKLVKSAEAMQKTEAELMDAEEKLRILGEQVRIKNETLKAQQDHLATLVQAALSLSHTPPEAMLMMPGDPAQIMMAARALRITSTSIRQETLSLGLQIAELEALKEKVTANRNTLADTQATLDKEHRDIVSKLADRTLLQQKLGKEQKQESEKLAHLAKKASDLQDLLTDIEKEENPQHESDVKHDKHEAHNTSGQLRSFANAKGRIHMPVAGRLVQKFGTSQGRNATSKGIIIHTARGAQVTSPYDGEVVFTGPFLNYGQMVIIRHSDDFHTLLAGLEKIDTSVGQFLLEGEPIGAMGDNETNNHSGNKAEKKNENRLYIELRKNNQPIDPASWISGLTSKN